MQLSKLERQEIFNLYNAAETARLIGMQVSDFHNEMRRGFLPMPTVKVGKRLYFRIADVERIAEHLNKEIKH